MNKFKNIFAVILSIFAVSCTKKDSGWFTADTIYQGFPIYLRYYKSVKLAECTKITLVTLLFDDVKDNGLPTDNSNNQSMKFDLTLSQLNEKNDFPILIETFAGKRKFYLFNNGNLPTDSVKSLCKKFPELNLAVEEYEDSGAEFIESYSTDLGQKFK